MSGRWDRLAVWAWAVMFAAVAVRVLLARPESHTVYPGYTSGTLRWLVGGPAYDMSVDVDVFRYPPPAAALFVPWAALPVKAGSLLWRAVGVAVFLLALVGWCRRLGVRAGPAALLAAPVVLPSLNNAQVNVLLAGLFMAGTLAAGAGRHWSAALCLGLAVVFKVYPVALALLVGLVAWRVLPRLAVVLAASLLLPLFVQSPEVAAGQYRAWATLVAADDRLAVDLTWCGRGLFLLWRVWLGMPDGAVYQSAQLATAVGVAALVLIGSRRAGGIDPPALPATKTQGADAPRSPRALPLAFDLGCLWMLLLGPATESCTYTLLAPTAAVAALTPGRLRPLAWAAYLLLVGTFASGTLPADWRVQALGPQPLAALLLVAWRLGTPCRAAAGADMIPARTAGGGSVSTRAAA